MTLSANIMPTTFKMVLSGTLGGTADSRLILLNTLPIHWRKAPHNASCDNSGIDRMLCIPAEYTLGFPRRSMNSPFRVTLSGSRMGDFLLASRKYNTSGVPSQAGVSCRNKTQILRLRHSSGGEFDNLRRDGGQIQN